MSILNEYLNYLNEQTILAKAGSFIAKNAAISAKWAAGTAAALIGLKVANTAFSSATRKCGGRIIQKHSPGFKICVARERIKALQQKINIYQTILSKCNTNSNPEICKQKYMIDIDKCKNRIKINQNKIQQLLGEQLDLEEQAGAVIGAAAKIGTIAAGLAVMMISDKAIFLLNRTVAAGFSQASRKCGIYKDNVERNLCISKIKLTILTTKLSKLKGILGQCKKEKNPNKCNEKVNKHIKKTIRDIQILKDSIITYTNQAETEKREKEIKVAMKAQKKGKV